MATRMDDIDVASGDTLTNCPYITGLVALPNNRLLVADFWNYAVKLYDTHSNTLISKLRLPSGPWDVAVIDIHKAAVTLPKSKTIVIVTVSDVLAEEREISVTGECHGVAYSNCRLVVTYCMAWRLKKPSHRGESYFEVMTLSGNVIRRVQRDGNGDQLFTVPWYVCVSNDGDTIYVSDWKRNSVTSFTFDGGVKSTFNDAQLVSPTQLCTDGYGHIYVCSDRSHDVFKLTADLGVVTVVLSEEDGLNDYVYSISHCKDTNKLYVGYVTIKVFQLDR